MSTSAPLAHRTRLGQTTTTTRMSLKHSFPNGSTPILQSRAAELLTESFRKCYHSLLFLKSKRRFRFELGRKAFEKEENYARRTDLRGAR